METSDLKLSHSTVFLNFFALITEEGFLISPCYSLDLGVHSNIQTGMSFGTLGSATVAEGRVLRGLGRMVAKKPVTHSAPHLGSGFIF